MEKISKHQLFCLVVMGQIGSTNLWALGIEAKQDAWLVIILSSIVGMGLIWLYTIVQSQYPEENIAGTIQSILGKVLGWPLSFIFFLVYIFNTTRNVSEFGDLINMTFLQDTPRIVITMIFLSTIIYILFLGIETFARITEIILPVTVSLIIFIYILIIASGRVDLKELFPVLGDGFKPVLKAMYPVTINFPFGLAILYFQIWPYAAISSKEIRRTTLWGVVMSAVILTCSLIIIITTLGVNLAANTTLPFLEIIKLINVGKFVTNIDAIGVILIFIGGMYLAIFHFLATVMILANLLRLKTYKTVMIPVAIFVLWYTNVYEPNYPFHVKYLVPQFWQQQVPLNNFCFVFLLLIMLLKNYIKGSKKKKSVQQ